MARSDLNNRLKALEHQAARGGNGFHVVIQRSGQTELEALAAYEAEHGPIGDDRPILRVLVRKPG